MKARVLAPVLALLAASGPPTQAAPGDTAPRPRLIVETDAGGDPDDEQSLVRLLLYTNDLDVVGIIANRPVAREGENRNPERTGLGIVRRQVEAYAQCWATLRTHDRRYPKPDLLRRRVVSGYADSSEGVDLIIREVDRRPVWFLNWGTDHGSAPSALLRALDRVRQERGPEGYARFKSRIRLSSSDKFGEHTTTLTPPFPFWVDTWRPEIDRRRWYHRFSALTATAGGFDVKRDVLTGHGPLGALYPTNTTHPQKEGDTMSFLYLIPTGMNDPDQPGWGSWAGRYGPNPEHPGKPYYWANQADTWEGTTSRDNMLRRWAADFQNDFRARLDWCVRSYAEANHPPSAAMRGSLERTVRSGREVRLDARPSADPDNQPLRFRWRFYPEATGYTGPLPEIHDANSAEASFTAPAVDKPQSLHVLLHVTDTGEPPLTRYRRLILQLRP